MTEEEFKRAIQAQRDLGRAQVGLMLDKMCRDFGMDPIEVWRLPRLIRERDRSFASDLIQYRVRNNYAIPFTFMAGIGPDEGFRIMKGIL